MRPDNLCQRILTMRLVWNRNVLWFFALGFLLKEFAINHGNQNIRSASMREQDGYSVVVPTFRRVAMIRRTITLWNELKCPNFKRLYISWADSDTDVADTIGDLLHSSQIEIEVFKPASSSLAYRFQIPPKLSTEAIFSLDDDLILTCDEIELAYLVWQLDPLRIVGFVPRGYSLAGKSLQYKTEFDAYSMILTDSSFISRSLIEIFWTHVPDEFLRFISQERNCEDIAFNLVVADRLKLHPILVRSSIKGYYVPGISSKQSHAKTRDRCLNFFAKTIGYNPLAFTRTRLEISKTTYKSHLFPLVSYKSDMPSL